MIEESNTGNFDLSRIFIVNNEKRFVDDGNLVNYKYHF